MKPIEQNKDKVLLHVRVQPKASRNAFCLEPDGRIRVALTAPPVEGAANKALVEFVAKGLRVPKRAVTIEKGDKSREKTLGILGVSVQDVQRLVETS